MGIIAPKPIHPDGDNMCALKVQLERDEELVFETRRAVLTSLRLLVNLDKKNQEVVTDDVSLRNVVSYKKADGGQESRMNLALRVFGVGAVLSLVQYFASSALPNFLNLGLFLAAAIGVVVGLYLTFGSLLRIRPYTSVVFSVVGSRDVPIYFPGFENTDADELIRHYVRVKRDLIIS